MNWNDDKIEIKGLTEDNAQSLKESHEAYDNPVYEGNVDVRIESDGSYTATYDRDGIKSYEQLGQDSALFGGQPETLYQ